MKEKTFEEVLDEVTAPQKLMGRREMAARISENYRDGRHFIYHKEILSRAIIELTESIMDRYGYENDENSNAELQNKVFDKLLRYIDHFASYSDLIKHKKTAEKIYDEKTIKEFIDDYKDTNTIGEFHFNKRTITFNDIEIKEFVLNLIESNKGEREYYKVVKSIDENDIYCGLTGNARESYIFNILYLLKHELLHVLKVQNEINKYGDLNRNCGLSLIGTQKKSLNKIFDQFDEVLNEYHTLVLLPQSQLYVQTKRQNGFKVKCQASIEDKKYQNAPDIFKNNEGANKIFISTYQKSANIAELFEIVVGKRELFLELMDGTMNLYNNFNDKYQECFTKHRDLINDYVRKLRGNGTDHYVTDHIEPMDILSYLVNAYSYNKSTKIQQIMQCLLLECLIKNINDQDTSKMDYRELNDYKKYLKNDLVPHVKNLIFISNVGVKCDLMLAENKFIELKDVCKQKLSEIQNVMQEASK